MKSPSEIEKIEEMIRDSVRIGFGGNIPPELAASIHSLATAMAPAGAFSSAGVLTPTKLHTPVKESLTDESTRVTVSSGIGNPIRKTDERELTMARAIIKDAALEFRMTEAREQWKDIKEALKYGQRTLLWGPPGTGKSRIGTFGVDGFVRVYLTLETPASDLRGHWLPNEKGGFKWHDGPATVAWRRGFRLQLEEIDRLSGDCEGHLLGVMDDRETAYFTLPSGETIHPKEGFSVVATTNENPNMLNSAVLDRFDTIFNVTLPNPDAFDQPWADEELCEAAKRAIYLPDNRPKTTNGRQIALRAFLAIDRMVAKGCRREDAARYTLGAEASTWLCTAMNLAAVAA